MYATGDRLVLIDEYQRVPELLDAIKAELNRELRPGWFVVTGSTDYSVIPRASQSLTGRAEVLTVWPFSQGELDARYETFTEILLADPARLWGTSSSASRSDYVVRVLAGGMPRSHVIDSGVGGWLLGLGSARLARRDRAALQQYGHLLEFFAVHEILKQVGWREELPQAGHFRTKGGLEVDLVLELFDGRVAAVEVKAGTVVRAEDCRGLAALRDRLGSEFIGGVVLHTGELAYRLADRLFAVPIDQLWT